MNRTARAIASPILDGWKWWERFWFQPTTPESLGVLRILAGGMVFYTHLVWGTALEPFFGSQGWQDPLLVQAFHRDSGAMSFWSYVPDPWLGTVHCLCLLVLLCFWLGVATRVSSILTFIIVVSYANRVPLATFGLDQINGLLTLYLAIGPSGDCYSIDRLWRRYRDASRAIQAGANVWKPVLQPRASAQLATRLIQVHMCVLYAVAGLSKLKGEAWWDGNAIWMGAANFEYQSGDLTWLAWHPWLCNLITHVTTFWETTFWVFVWNPRLRPFVLMVGVLMHFGIGAFLGMWTFGLVMTFTYVGFVPPEVVAGCVDRLRRHASIVVDCQPNVPWSRAKAAWRCARSSASSFVLKPAASSTGGPEPAGGAARRLVRVPMSAGDWWRALCALKSSKWKLRPTEGNQAPYPKELLIVSSILTHLTRSQEYFNAHGFATRVASDAPQACVALSCRAAQAVIVYAYHPEELEEIRLFREICIAGGEQAPITVVAIYKTLLELVDWKPTRDHAIVVFPLSLRELRHEACAAWMWRNKIGDAPDRDTRRSSPDEALPDSAAPAARNGKDLTA